MPPQLRPQLRRELPPVARRAVLPRAALLQVGVPGLAFLGRTLGYLSIFGGIKCMLVAMDPRFGKYMDSSSAHGGSMMGAVWERVGHAFNSVHVPNVRCRCLHCIFGLEHTDSLY